MKASGLRGAAVALGLLLAATAPALAMGLDPAYPQAPELGPAKAKGVVIWSHGRSLASEDWKSPTPPYLEALRADGWDVMRFDRLHQDDSLNASKGLLVGYAAKLKHEGYRQVVLAGQSFGGFLSLMAADDSSEVDAVVATAPAAFGAFDDESAAWQLNAIRLYPLLADVRHARVMVFYFHDDDFDPGGRGEHSREILSGRGLGYAVIDQPFYLTGHWAASSGLFLRRFGDCVRDFADAAGLAHAFACTPKWGTAPSAALKLPPELTGGPVAEPVSTRPQASGASVAGSAAPAAPSGLVPAWYGFYPNGREALLAIESERGDAINAVYAIGPSIDNKYPAAWTRRIGHKIGDEYVFDESGKNTLRFRLSGNGALAATWVAEDGKSKLTGQLRPIDLGSLGQRADAGGTQPQ